MRSRRINKAKKVARSCRNHGSCGFCLESRLHSARKRIESCEQKLKEALGAKEPA